MHSLPLRHYPWNFQNVILFKQDFKNVVFMVLKVVKSYQSIWIAILRTYKHLQIFSRLCSISSVFLVNSSMFSLIMFSSLTKRRRNSISSFPGCSEVSYRWFSFDKRFWRSRMYFFAFWTSFSVWKSLLCLFKGRILNAK